jgi:hypothetical protein
MGKIAHLLNSDGGLGQEVSGPVARPVNFSGEEKQETAAHRCQIPSKFWLGRDLELEGKVRQMSSVLLLAPALLYHG